MDTSLMKDKNLTGQSTGSLSARWVSSSFLRRHALGLVVKVAYVRHATGEMPEKLLEGTWQDYSISVVVSPIPQNESI